MRAIVLESSEVNLPIFLLHLFLIPYTLCQWKCSTTRVTRSSDDTLEKSIRLGAKLQAAGVADIGQRVSKSIDLMRTVAVFATRTKL
jgi:hypothetical protein